MISFGFWNEEGGKSVKRLREGRQIGMVVLLLMTHCCLLLILHLVGWWMLVEEEVKIHQRIRCLPCILHLDGQGWMGGWKGLILFSLVKNLGAYVDDSVDGLEDLRLSLFVGERHKLGQASVEGLAEFDHCEWGRILQRFSGCLEDGIRCL